jgi:hypothetical protein
VHDVHRRRRVEAGLLVADTVEYVGAETLPAASLVVHYQLKYSTKHVGPGAVRYPSAI